jgi:hypothetical protein
MVRSRYKGSRASLDKAYTKPTGLPRSIFRHQSSKHYPNISVSTTSRAFRSASPFQYSYYLIAGWRSALLSFPSIHKIHQLIEKPSVVFHGVRLLLPGSNCGFGQLNDDTATGMYV